MTCGQRFYHPSLQYVQTITIERLWRAERYRGVDKKVTVQKICRVCKDEKDIRSILDEIWRDPKEARYILTNMLSKNQNVFEFEKALTK